MKKTVFLLLLVGIAMLGFAQNGVVKELTGTVELKSSGAAAFVAAKAGDIVSQDTVVSTGFKSTALIEVGNTTLTVRPLTRLTLTEIKASSDSETVNLSIQAGRVRVDVNPPAGSKASLAVSSPTATASVRGTSFEFDTRNLYVSSGSVMFQGARGEPTLITAGYNSTTDQNGSAVNPLAFGSAAYKPQMPAGTQANASPAPATTIDTREPTPTEPTTPTNPTAPTNPTTPTTPANPGNGGGGGNGNNNGSGGSGIDVTVGY